MSYKGINYICIGRSYDEESKLSSEVTKHTYSCDCGHRVFIPHCKEKEICSWCFGTVYKNRDKERFKTKIKQMIGVK